MTGPSIMGSGQMKCEMGWVYKFIKMGLDMKASGLMIRNTGKDSLYPKTSISNMENRLMTKCRSSSIKMMQFMENYRIK